MSAVRNSARLLALALAVGPAAAGEPGTIMERILQEHEAQTVELGELSGLLDALTRQVHSEAPDPADPATIASGFTGTAVQPLPASGTFLGTASAAAWEGPGSGPTALPASGSVIIEGARSAWTGIDPAGHAWSAPVTAMTLEQGQQYVVTNSASSAGNVHGAINIGATGLTNSFGDLSTSTIGAVNSGSVQITIGELPARPAP